MRFIRSIIAVVIFMPIILFCAGHSITEEETVTINLENKKKILVLPFTSLKDGFFDNWETYEYLSKFLNEEITTDISDTGGFEVTNLTKETPDVKFDINNAYVSDSGISRSLFRYVKNNNFDMVIHPMYMIYSTVDSSGADQILSLSVKVFLFDVKTEKVSYTDTKTSVAGIDISLFQGVSSMTGDGENKSKTEEENKDKEKEQKIENERNIADKSKTSFSFIIKSTINGLAIFVQKQEIELSQTDDIDPAEEPNNTDNTNPEEPNNTDNTNPEESNNTDNTNPEEPNNTD